MQVVAAVDHRWVGTEKGETGLKCGKAAPRSRVAAHLGEGSKASRGQPAPDPEGAMCVAGNCGQHGCSTAIKSVQASSNQITRY
jgi:hypothetical protein